MIVFAAASASWRCELFISLWDTLHNYFLSARWSRAAYDMNRHLDRWLSTSEAILNKLCNLLKVFAMSSAIMSVDLALEPITFKDLTNKFETDDFFWKKTNTNSA